ncbi:hypothetical protein Sjap_019286 [Stephania japonica]|uniref:Uncharacterized protein n=1 Tax=Stephania japonica TaxID=461633 RepID=A0AAP0F3Z3_9MAGN
MGEKWRKVDDEEDDDEVHLNIQEVVQGSQNRNSLASRTPVRTLGGRKIVPHVRACGWSREGGRRWCERNGLTLPVRSSGPAGGLGRYTAVTWGRARKRHGHTLSLTYTLARAREKSIERREIKERRTAIRGKRGRTVEARSSCQYRGVSDLDVESCSSGATAGGDSSDIEGVSCGCIGYMYG